MRIVTIHSVLFLKVEKIIVHHDMRFTEPWAHDIALVKMAEPLV